MDVQVLVPLLMGALLQVAGKIGDGALGAVEEAAQNGATAVFDKIKSWWSRDSSASDDLARFEAEPDIYQPVVEARLVQKFTAEPERLAEFAALMERIGPQVEVFQTVAEANGITGAKVQEMTRGRVNVDQRIQNASDVTGVDFGRLG